MDHNEAEQIARGWASEKERRAFVIEQDLRKAYMTGGVLPPYSLEGCQPEPGFFNLRKFFQSFRRGAHIIDVG